MTVPPIQNPRAYATPLLLAYKRQLLQQEGRPNAPLLALITAELRRRKEPHQSSYFLV